MSERFDAIVIGAGPGGEVAADRLLKAGRHVALVERELIGGECGYWACIPSKTLIRPPEASAETERAAGVDRGRLDWPDAAAYRDYMVRGYDDAKQIRGYRDQGATVVKAAGRLVGEHTVEAGGERLQADHVILATGSDPVIPPIPGLDSVPIWTNREATALKEVPPSVLVIGGGPVGVELGQMLRRFRAEVTIVEGGPHLASREEPRVGELLQEALGGEGVDVRVGRSVERVEPAGAGAIATLDDGSRVEAAAVLVATGRRPRLKDLGLEAVGVEPSHRGVEVDERCRVRDWLWAVGDVTGVMQFTHVAKYQGRVVADNILGRDRRAHYGGVPRVMFTDPEIAAVGQTEAQAREAGGDVATARLSLPEQISRPWTYERDPRGELGLVADRARGILLGAWAFAPLASEWIHVAALAVRAEIPVAVLLETVAQFPTYNEAYLLALERLDLTA